MYQFRKTRGTNAAATDDAVASEAPHIDGYQDDSIPEGNNYINGGQEGYGYHNENSPGEMQGGYYTQNMYGDNDPDASADQRPTTISSNDGHVVTSSNEANGGAEIDPTAVEKNPDEDGEMDSTENTLGHSVLPNPPPEASAKDVLTWCRQMIESRNITPPKQWRRIRFDLPDSVPALRLYPPNPEPVSQDRPSSCIVLQLEDSKPDGISVHDYTHQMVSYLLQLLQFHHSSTAITELRAVKKGADVLHQLVVVFGTDVKVAITMVESLRGAGVPVGYGLPRPAPAADPPNATFHVIDFLQIMHQDEQNEEGGGNKEPGVTEKDLHFLFAPYRPTKTIDVEVIRGFEPGVFYVPVKRPETVLSFLCNAFCSVLLQSTLFERYGILVVMAQCPHEFLLKGIPYHIQKKMREEEEERRRRQEAAGGGDPLDGTRSLYPYGSGGRKGRENMMLAEETLRAIDQEEQLMDNESDEEENMYTKHSAQQPYWVKSANNIDIFASVAPAASSTSREGVGSLAGKTAEHPITATEERNTDTEFELLQVSRSSVNSSQPAKRQNLLPPPPPPRYMPPPPPPSSSAVPYPLTVQFAEGGIPPPNFMDSRSILSNQASPLSRQRQALKSLLAEDDDEEEEEEEGGHVPAPSQQQRQLTSGNYYNGPPYASGGNKFQPPSPDLKGGVLSAAPPPHAVATYHPSAAQWGSNAASGGILGAAPPSPSQINTAAVLPGNANQGGGILGGAPPSGGYASLAPTTFAAGNNVENEVDVNGDSAKPPFKQPQAPAPPPPAPSISAEEAEEVVNTIENTLDGMFLFSHEETSESDFSSTQFMASIWRNRSSLPEIQPASNEDWLSSIPSLPKVPRPILSCSISPASALQNFLILCEEECPKLQSLLLLKGCPEEKNQVERIVEARRRLVRLLLLAPQEADRCKDWVLMNPWQNLTGSKVGEREEEEASPKDEHLNFVLPAVLPYMLRPLGDGVELSDKRDDPVASFFASSCGSAIILQWLKSLSCVTKNAEEDDGNKKADDEDKKQSTDQEHTDGKDNNKCGITLLSQDEKKLETVALASLLTRYALPLLFRHPTPLLFEILTTSLTTFEELRNSASNALPLDGFHPLVTHVLAHWPALIKWLSGLVTSISLQEEASHQQQQRMRLTSSACNAVDKLLAAVSKSSLEACRAFSKEQDFMNLFFSPSVGDLSQRLWGPHGALLLSILRLYLNAEVLEGMPLAIAILSVPPVSNASEPGGVTREHYRFFLTALSSSYVSPTLSKETAAFSGVFIRAFEVHLNRVKADEKASVDGSPSKTGPQSTFSEKEGCFFIASAIRSLTANKDIQPQQTQSQTTGPQNAASMAGLSIYLALRQSYFDLLVSGKLIQRWGLVIEKECERKPEDINNESVSSSEKNIIDSNVENENEEDVDKNQSGPTETKEETDEEKPSTSDSKVYKSSILEEHIPAIQRILNLRKLPSAADVQLLLPGPSQSTQNNNNNNSSVASNPSKPTASLPHWDPAWTEIMSKYPKVGPPFTQPLPSSYTAELSRSYGFYYYKPKPVSKVHASPTYKHPITGEEYMATPQAFLREPSVTTTLRDLVQYASTQLGSSTNSVTMKEAEAWFHDQRIRHPLLDAAVLLKFKVTYKMRGTSSGGGRTNSERSRQQGTTSESHSSHENYDERRRRRGTGNGPSDETLDYLLKVTDSYPSNPESPPYPVLPRGWTAHLSTINGLYMFRSQQPPSSGGGAAGGGFHQHPTTRSVYRVTPQALAKNRRVNPARLRELALSIARERQKGVPEASKDNKDEVKRDSAVPNISSEDEEKWWNDQRYRHLYLDRAVVQLLRVDYEYGDEQIQNKYQKKQMRHSGGYYHSRHDDDDDDKNEEERSRHKRHRSDSDGEDSGKEDRHRSGEDDNDREDEWKKYRRSSYDRNYSSRDYDYRSGRGGSGGGGWAGGDNSSSYRSYRNRR